MKFGEDARHATQAQGPAASGVEPMTLRDVATALRSRLKLLALCLAGGAALAGVHIVTTPFLYRADMALLLDPRERVPVGMDAQAMPQNPDPALVESHMRLLTSRSVLRDVVENEQLLKDPDFAWSPGMLSRLRGMVVKPQDAVDRAADALGRAIAIKRSDKSYMVDIGLVSTSPEKAERLARALFHAYTQSQRKLHDNVANQQTAWLDQRVRDLHARLMQAEHKAREFRQAGAFLMTDGKVIPESQLRDANAGLAAARARRADLESRFDQIQAAIRSGRADALGEALRSTVIDKLRADHAALAREEASARNILGPRHPAYLATESQMRAVDQQIAAELRRIAGAAERELKAARKAEESADKLVASLQNQTNDLGGRRSELEQFEREVATLRAAYEKAMSNRENVRRDIVAAPVGYLADAPSAARSPTQPRITPTIIIALGASFNLWAAICIFQLARSRGRTAPTPAATQAAPATTSLRVPAQQTVHVATLAKSRAFSVTLPFMEWAVRRAARQSPPSQWPPTASTLAYRSVVGETLAGLRAATGGAPAAVAIVSHGFYTGKSTFAHALAEAARASDQRAVILGLDAPRDAGRGVQNDGLRETCGRRDLARRIARGDADLYLVDAGALSECERALRDAPLAGLILMDEDEAIEALKIDLAEEGVAHPVLAEIATPDLLMARRA